MQQKFAPVAGKGGRSARSPSSPWWKSDRAVRDGFGPDARSSEAPNTRGIQASGDAADGPESARTATRSLSPRAARQAIHQGFLPSDRAARAFVWKYSPVNWGRRPRHFHAEPELNLIASGHATFGVGETVVEAAQGDLLRFPPAQDHVLLKASPDLYLFAIGMDPVLSSEVLRREADETMLPLRFRLTGADFDALIRRASAIVDRDGIEQQCAELWEHAYWLSRRPQTRPATTMHVLTRRALSAVSQEPNLGLELLSNEMRAASSEISRYFHRDVGMTFVQFRTRLRLLRLIHLVDAADMTVGSAAPAAGFGSYSQCHRAFQTQLGCSPHGFFRAGLRQRMQQAYDP